MARCKNESLMNKDSPYSGSSEEVLIEKRPALMWTRMLRFSIYFTVMGIILAILKLKLAAGRRRATAGADIDDQVEGMSQMIDEMVLSAQIMLAFVLMGVIFIVLSLIMRRREKRLYDHSN